MAAILEVKNGPMAGKDVVVKTGQTVLVGRAAGRANFAVLHDTFMSGIHFSIECGPQGDRVIDQSSNGTYLNGAKITEAMLANGDEIRSGQTVFKVRLLADDKLPAARSAAPPPSVRPKEEAARSAESRAGSGVLKMSREARPGPSNAPQPSVFPTPNRRLSSPKPVPNPRPAPPMEPPILTVGSWSFSVIPQGWGVKDEFGIERTEKDAFPSSVIVTEELLGAGVALQQFVEAQLSMLRKYLKDPKLEASLPPAIRGSDETVAVDVRYKTKDDQAIVYQRLYVHSGQTVGTITLTTLGKDLEQTRPAFEAILKGITFRKNETSSVIPGSNSGAQLQ